MSIQLKVIQDSSPNSRNESSCAFRLFPSEQCKQSSYTISVFPWTQLFITSTLNRLKMLEVEI